MSSDMDSYQREYNQMLSELPEHAWNGYCIVLRRDERSGRVCAYPAGSAWAEWYQEPVTWDGKGIALVSRELAEDRLLQHRPEVGDEIEIEGVDYVVVNMRADVDGYCVMRTSMEAHRLALFHLTYPATIAARWWYARAERDLHNERFGYAGNRAV